MILLSEIGWRAAAALGRTGGGAHVLTALSESVYLTAGDEIVWLGRPGAPMHPRAMLTAGLLPTAGEVAIDGRAARAWTPPTVSCDAETARALRAGCRDLVAALAEVGEPDGFGVLLAGIAPAFPLDGAVSRARALASACAADTPAPAAAAAATRLLGLGPGLTPSGDDYVGGVFFARALLAGAGACDGAAWMAAGALVLERARERTHPVSVALLGDMLEGQAYAPLHDLARALADGAPRDRALGAARRLVQIGHSSGWDMLAGFVAGITDALRLNGAP